MLDSGEGDDTLYGDGGADMLIGGAGVDALYGDSSDTPDAAMGDDTLDGGDGDDDLDGGDGDDIIVVRAGSGTKHISGGDGNDTLWIEGVNFSAISLRLGSLLIDTGVPGGEIHVDGFNASDPQAGSGIESFQFDDGVRSYQQVLAKGFDLNGTPGADVITGTGAADRIDADVSTTLLGNFDPRRMPGSVRIMDVVPAARGSRKTSRALRRIRHRYAWVAGTGVTAKKCRKHLLSALAFDPDQYHAQRTGLTSDHPSTPTAFE